MRASVSLLFSLALCACASSVERPPERPEERAPAASSIPAAAASSIPAAPDDECPPGFGAPSDRDPCGRDPELRCEYEEGSCECVVRTYCRGIPPEPGWTPEVEYRCTPRVREDGCPGPLPPEGSPCEREMSCTYSPDCCGEGVRARCAEGSWAYETFTVSCPP